MKKILSLLALLLTICSGAWAATEQIKTVTKDAQYDGTCVTVGKDHFAQTKSNATYIKYRTGKYSNTWVFTVKEGYKVTGIHIVGYSNNTDATISMTSLKADDAEQLSESKVFPVSGTAEASYVDINVSGFEVDGTKTIVCTFDNSKIDGTTTGKKNTQVMAAVTLTYEQTATLYTATFANGGHGTAPSTQSDVLAVTLPTIGEDWYQNTGWTANQDVTVGGETVTAGTTIACGATATLAANTTFTAQWASSDYPYAVGVTFPTYPTGTLDMTTQTDYTPSDGYVVERLLNIRNSSKTWYSDNEAGSASGQQWTKPTGSVFTSQTEDANVLALMQATKTYAVKFTGTTEFQALMNSRLSGSYVHAKLVDVTSTKTVVATKDINGISNNANPTLTSDHIAKFTGLTPSHTYVVFFYGYSDSGNGLIYEIALKDPSAEVAVTGVTVDETASVEVGKTVTLTATVAPDNADNKNVSWESDATGVATVNANGVVTGVAEGTANITVTTEDGSFTDVCVVTVTAAATGITTVTNKTWDINNMFTSNVSATTISDNMEVVTTTSLSVSQSSKTFPDGSSFSRNIQLKSSGSGKLHIKVAPNSKITVYTTGGSNRTLKVIEGENELLSVAVTSTAVNPSCVYTGTEDADIYISNGGGSNGLAIYAVKVVPATIINLNASGFATYSSATDFEYLGADAYGMKLSATSLVGTKVTSGKIKAGEGILFKGEAGAKVAITETTGAEAIGDANNLIGTTTEGGDLISTAYTYKYALNGDTFKTFTGSLVANKAFFGSDTEFTNSLELVFDEEATAVEAVAEAKAEAAAPIKVIKNGKLFIGNYNVAGQLIK